MQRTWWKEGIVYQIYPRSFNDTNGDGIGDLRGIINKLDYLQELGIDIIWLCPVYESPNDDNGYDISDYYNIMQEFGTMADFDELLAGMKARGLRLVMDLVANHTSDEHQWFLDSRSSPDHPKRDYYIWKDGESGNPPNNWKSFFSGSAWEKDNLTDQYYLHLFTRKQPDLNWENPEVRREIYDVMKFWLDKGIDGFRMDVISVISKRNYQDTPYESFNETISKVYANGPKVHDYLQEMNREVMSKYDMMTVGEGPGINLENGLEYVHQDRKELNMVFHFDHMFIDHGPEGKFDVVPYDFIHFKNVFTKWDNLLADKGWGSIFLGNHDFPRLVSRFGNDSTYRTEAAKLFAVLLLSLRGTTYIYQGDEIGMTNVKFDTLDDYRDVETINAHREYAASGRDLNVFMKAVHHQGRDNARTPIQWDDTTNAGFTTGEPWIKLNPNYPEINVAAQENNPDSVLNFYRRMIRFRRENLTLVYGDYHVVQPEHNELFIYKRQDREKSFLVVHNFSDNEVTFTTEETTELEEVINNYQEPARQPARGQVILNAWQSVIFNISEV